MSATFSPRTPRGQQDDLPSTPYSNSPFKSLYNQSPSTSSPLSRQYTSHSSTSRLAPSPKPNSSSSSSSSSKSLLVSDLPTGSRPATPQDIPKGRWRHPAFDELNKRVASSEFTQVTSQKIIQNAVALAVYSIVVKVLGQWNWIEEFELKYELLSKAAHYFGLILQVIFIWNIISGALRLFNKKDNLEDIPLTPNQRRLMGLSDSGKGLSPASPLTPPKYVKTFGSSRESPHASPLIKKSMQEAIAKNAQQQQQQQSSPRTPGAQTSTRSSSTSTPQRSGALDATKIKHSPSSPLASPAIPGSMSFSASGRYLYNISDSPGRKSPFI
ncbi:nuclear pore complex component-domain-containing protein [Myxozyma melibiosi]|uniref:Nuclear pore complex component-domain-containing protein n=1 Tax=Myxozyma melibiosi TaxID=54550 RepID=A0ABR1F6U3_9ASCO